MFALSLRPTSVDVGTTNGSQIEFFRSVLTGLSVLPLLVGSGSTGTDSRAGGACCAVSGRMS